MNDQFGVIQGAANKIGSRWIADVTTIDDDGRLTATPIRPCRTKRELMARSDVLLAKLSATPGYDPAMEPR
ncbi:hypothetical protein [Falsiroseomonas sp. CW058]|uniref:hypothetical protein n=1 Tax=Falsiroseomonas sp. CW058 TaxID=3388664 RepID=UPI003D31A0A6